MPFKVFVLLAGVVGMPFPQFTVGVIVGRGIRYLGEGLLAVWYGERAFAFLESNARTASIGLAATALIGGILYARISDLVVVPYPRGALVAP
jgi:membrane protein DedA with SNARE-associated domain